MQQLDESMARYLNDLDRADREPAAVPAVRVTHLKEKIATVKEQVRKLRRIEKQLQEAPDQQVSLTDRDARSMATSGRGTGIVGYNVQAVVDARHHMIVAHEVTNVGHDRAQLTAMAKLGRDAIGEQQLTVLADRGYFDGKRSRMCAEEGITTLVPKPLTSNSKADGRFDKRDFIYNAKRDRVPVPRGTTRDLADDDGRKRSHDAPILAFGVSPLSDQVSMHTYAITGRIARWEHEQVLDDMQHRLDRAPSWATTTTDRRAPVRNAQGMDGLNPFSQDVAEGPNGNDPASPGVQPETGVEHLWNAAADCLHAGIAPLVAKGRPHRTTARTLPRFSRPPTSTDDTFSHSLGRLRPLVHPECRRSPQRLLSANASISVRP